MISSDLPGSICRILLLGLPDPIWWHFGYVPVEPSDGVERFNSMYECLAVLQGDGEFF